MNLGNTEKHLSGRWTWEGLREDKYLFVLTHRISIIETKKKDYPPTVCSSIHSGLFPTC